TPSKTVYSKRVIEFSALIVPDVQEPIRSRRVFCQPCEPTKHALMTMTRVAGESNKAGTVDPSDVTCTRAVVEVVGNLLQFGHDAAEMRFIAIVGVIANDGP